jgi:hypothetical protein
LAEYQISLAVPWTVSNISFFKKIKLFKKTPQSERLFSGLAKQDKEKIIHNEICEENVLFQIIIFMFLLLETFS